MRASARIRHALPGLFRTAPGRLARSRDAPCPQSLNATPVFRYSPRLTARGGRELRRLRLAGALSGRPLACGHPAAGHVVQDLFRCNHRGAVRQYLAENTRRPRGEAPWARKLRRAECHAAGGQRATGPAPWTWPHDRDRPQDPEKCWLFGHLSGALRALGQRPRQRPCSRMTGSGLWCGLAEAARSPTPYAVRRAGVW